MLLEGIKRYGVIFLAWLLLVMSFYGNFFQVGLSKDWFTSFQADSQSIVENSAVCKGTYGYDGPAFHESSRSFFDINVSKKDFCSYNAMKPYNSQYGAQTRVVAAFAPQDGQGMDRYISRAELLLAMLAAAVIMLIVGAVYRLVGLVPASVTYGLIAISTWIVGYARNLYWFEWLMILPFAFALAAYPWFKKKQILWLFYSIELLIIYVKLLNGYEHVSTIAISILAAIVLHETIKSTASLWSYWRQAVIVAAISAIALGGAIATHLTSLSHYYQSWNTAVAHLRERSDERSIAGMKKMQPHVIQGLYATLPEVYMFIDRFIDLEALKEGSGSFAKYMLLSAFNYLLLPAVTLPVTITGVFGVILQSVGAFMVYGFLSIRRIKRSRRYKKYYRSLLYSFWVSMAAWFSWVVLMPGHIYPHAHLNAIIFYLPMMFICYIAIGCVIAENIGDRKA